ncbi:hypothetical protein BDN70DRAFT_878219 [Pholiota conissans]|uniref:Uncharacterized protein n=1 Tax=Pholiota conissans TaxID=109636 RepID=A0A9P6CUS8_9AGAR|nr:hypothetical protein BDN70DRAFT_878219 [Pholiota conissans]
MVRVSKKRLDIAAHRADNFHLASELFYPFPTVISFLTPLLIPYSQAMILGDILSYTIALYFNQSSSFVSNELLVTVSGRRYKPFIVQLW